MIKTVIYKLLVLVSGFGLGAWLIIFGVGAFALPFIGLPVGLILIFLGIMMPIVGIAQAIKATPADYKRSTYQCPNCNNPVTIIAYQKAVNCRVCRRRLLPLKTGFRLA